ncbi:MAG: hypothetical protein PHR94_14200 [Methylomonas lenta]|nr:hypothetical protein [Methylomonas lenta]
MRIAKYEYINGKVYAMVGVKPAHDVLSTNLIALGRKIHHYCKLASQEEYVLIAQDTQRVECYRRADAWDLHLYQQNQRAWFKSIGLELLLADIYEGVAFAELPATPE